MEKLGFGGHSHTRDAHDAAIVGSSLCRSDFVCVGERERQDLEGLAMGRCSLEEKIDGDDDG